ncbi:MAG: SUMF1/EgtB/PvdO family nonheme iron enzyme [Candidatus Cloacimonetes bacterium]|nr:SUMF1/EgtB/PvdO family nonheme iron enzyme [Candidatus Cloacimonadota bacterium]
MKYFCLIVLALLLLSCSEEPAITNPYDTNFDLPEPENLQVEHISLTTKKVSWDYDFDNFDGFKISRKQNGVWLEGEIVAVEDNSYTYENVPVNENIQYKIIAYAGENSSDEVLSDIIVNTIPAPENLAYEIININEIRLSWEYEMAGIDGFRIDKKAGTGEWFIYTIVAADSTRWIDENAEINEDLQYRVYAYYGDFKSNTIETGFIDNTFPFPENLSLEIINENEIRLSWEYVMAWIDGFRIDKRYVDGDWQLYEGNIGAELREWEDDNTNYLDSYRIRAYYQGYESGNSNVVVNDGMIYVAGGTFEMGDHFNEGNDNELPVHDVTISNFLIGAHEVTQGEYEALMRTNPAHDNGVGYDYPVYNVSWYDAVEYCNALSELVWLTPCYDTSDWSCDFSADGYRLPTEAEWEYAARGGVNWEDNYRYSGTTDNLEDYAWYYSNSGDQTHEVGTKLPNQLGIYNVSGNVFEWCNDLWDWDYYESSSGENPTGPALGSYRVFRGGSWFSGGSDCRSASRNNTTPDWGNYKGFRLARR